MKLILLALVLNSTVVQAKSPDWINKLDKDKKLCQVDKEICAVGVGESESLAKSNARAEILKFFKTKINSKFTSELTLIGKDISETSGEKIEEITEGVISGIEIRKTDEDEINFYALGVLNKRNAAKIMANEIKALDEKIVELRASKDTKDLFEVEDRYIEREALYERYLLVSKNKIPAAVSFKDVFQSKKEAIKGVLIKVEIQEEGKKAISSLVKKEISNLGFKMASVNTTHTLTGKFYPEKMHMNVDGFEKYNFILEIIVENKKGERNTLKESFQAVGRNYDQAHGKVLEQVGEYLANNLKKINFN